MGDIIVKWRVASVPTVVELVKQMPKSIMPKDRFNSIMDKSIYGTGFRRTAYQLACQLGLYYINENNEFVPRFQRNISEDEARWYMESWVRLYSVPNPYTKSFNADCKPRNLVKSIVDYLSDNPGKHKFEDVLNSIFGETVGNLSPTRFFLSEYTDIFDFDTNDNISLNNNFTPSMLLPEDRNNKDAFFHEFDSNMQFINIPNIEELGALQKIYFGAPGTGKSHTINSVCAAFTNFRTTFHPDSDYSSFVGSYKPTLKNVKLRDLSGHVVQESNEDVMAERIVYSFVKQVFLKAYIAAWEEQAKETPSPVFLIIEEINRGNCAQIFGDIFQLLDRNNSGFSDYPIVADDDLQRELKAVLSKLNIVKHNEINSLYKGDKDVVSMVKDGSHLLLPNNLYIWATMNTSDQSLFPIDSAFKRRWDWKYVNIKNHEEENYKIVFSNGHEYSWWGFLSAINERIEGGDIQQEDKKLGYFFAKAKDGVISADTFLSKVIFFLYNDVFKDFGFEEDFFKDEDGKPMTFASYFNHRGDIIENRVERFLTNLGQKPIAETDINFDGDNVDTTYSEEVSDGSKYSVNGKTYNYMIDAVKEVATLYLNKYSNLSDEEIVEEWKNIGMPSHALETAAMYEARTDMTKRRAVKPVKRHDGVTFYVSTQLRPQHMNSLINKAKEWGISLERI